MNYLKQSAQVFGAAWNGRKYSIKSPTALRAFIRVAPDVVRRLDQEHADRADFRAIEGSSLPWAAHRRFEVRDQGEEASGDGGVAAKNEARPPVLRGRPLAACFRQAAELAPQP